MTSGRGCLKNDWLRVPHLFVVSLYETKGQSRAALESPFARQAEISSAVSPTEFSFHGMARS